jgi:uncharacterized radical SAM superfamily Fe-S cluster-containing enzyme
MKKKEKIKDITKSFCPVCLKVIPAIVSVKKGKVVITKFCKEHGRFESFHVWDDPYFYKRMWKLYRLYNSEESKENGIVLDLTSRCNLRCPICFAFGGEERFGDLSINKIKEILIKFKRHHILLYGGEPTLRDDLPNIINIIKRLGSEPILLTNGIKLNRVYISKLKKAGLRRVVLQFDGLDDNLYKIIRGAELLNKKLEVIKILEDEGMNLDLFVMLVKGVTENQIPKIISFAKNLRNIGTIYFSPASFEGRLNIKIGKVYTSEVLEIIEKEAGIKKEDFITCTEFDWYLSKLVRNFGIFKTPSFCHPACYVYIKDGKLVPLNKVIDLKALTDDLKNIYKIRKEKQKLKYILYVSSFLFRFLIKITKVIGFDNMLRASFFLFRKRFAEKFPNIFRIDVFVYQDRYNADLRMIEKCNLLAEMPNGMFDSFCKRNILQVK